MKQRQLTAKILWFWMKHRFNPTKISDNFIDADGYFGSQCVDLIRALCKEVYGYTMPALDKARNMSSFHFSPKKWREILPGRDKLMMGDIVSVDLVPKNENGHIFFIYKQTPTGYYYIDQNGIGGAGKRNKDGSYPKKKGNGVERRFAKRGHFQILKVYRYKTQ